MIFDWVEIRAGDFLMGGSGRHLEVILSEDAEKFIDDEHLVQHVTQVASYQISKTPVTVAQFRQFVEDTGYKTTAEIEGGAGIWGNGKVERVAGANWRQPHGPTARPIFQEEHPVVCVSWHDTQAFCAWATVRLPTEAEWEKAARGTDGRIFPWGDELPNENRCNFLMNIGNTTSVGHYPHGVSPYGVLDMVGNVWEWTSSLWGQDFMKPNFGYPYTATDGREDRSAPDTLLRVLRGGAFHQHHGGVRCAYRFRQYPSFRYNGAGFRVVY